jgi:hypothetical protein
VIIDLQGRRSRNDALQAGKQGAIAFAHGIAKLELEWRCGREILRGVLADLANELRDRGNIDERECLLVQPVAARAPRSWRLWIIMLYCHR